jgi:hypothetical protein
MQRDINPGRDSYVPVIGIHEADEDTDSIRAETRDVLATVTYDPEDECTHDVTNHVDRRGSPRLTNGGTHPSI